MWKFSKSTLRTLALDSPLEKATGKVWVWKKPGDFPPVPAFVGHLAAVWAQLFSLEETTGHRTQGHLLSLPWALETRDTMALYYFIFNRTLSLTILSHSGLRTIRGCFLRGSWVSCTHPRCRDQNFPGSSQAHLLQRRASSIWSQGWEPPSLKLTTRN